jgi:hypothetical protein
MKSLLALVTLAVTVLIFDQKIREVAGDAQEAYNGVVTQASDAKQALTDTIERQPLIALFAAGGIAYLLASIIPSRN